MYSHTQYVCVIVQIFFELQICNILKNLLQYYITFERLFTRNFSSPLARDAGLFSLSCQFYDMKMPFFGISTGSILFMAKFMVKIRLSFVLYWVYFFNLTIALMILFTLWKKQPSIFSRKF